MVCFLIRTTFNFQFCILGFYNVQLPVKLTGSNPSSGPIFFSHFTVYLAGRQGNRAEWLPFFQNTLQNDRKKKVTRRDLNPRVLLEVGRCRIWSAEFEVERCTNRYLSDAIARFWVRRPPLWCFPADISFNYIMQQLFSSIFRCSSFLFTIQFRFSVYCSNSLATLLVILCGEYVQLRSSDAIDCAWLPATTNNTVFSVFFSFNP